jgi:hypothetical protein
VLDAQQTRGLEAIVHAKDVQLHRHMRGMVAAQEVGQVHYALRLRCRHCRHHVVELRHISAHAGNLPTEISE